MRITYTEKGKKQEVEMSATFTEALEAVKRAAPDIGAVTFTKGKSQKTYLINGGISHLLHKSS